MNTLILSPASGRLSELAVRAGLALARWGRRRAARAGDRDRMLRTLAARSAAREALDERDRVMGAALLTLSRPGEP
ncbi:hypothetical protein GCM10009819_25460 [Agromyces tropicus]|uniref:Uncharacterized protein n=1 Tax=Agromyces tropicus TaxID=555371 RepID=A0ABN2UMD9_9MICO